MIHVVMREVVTLAPRAQIEKHGASEEPAGRAARQEGRPAGAAIGGNHPEPFENAQAETNAVVLQIEADAGQEIIWILDACPICNQPLNTA